MWDIDEYSRMFKQLLFIYSCDKVMQSLSTSENMPVYRLQRVFIFGVVFNMLVILILMYNMVWLKHDVYESKFRMLISYKI